MLPSPKPLVAKYIPNQVKFESGYATLNGVDDAQSEAHALYYPKQYFFSYLSKTCPRDCCVKVEPIYFTLAVTMRWWDHWWDVAGRGGTLRQT